MDRFAADLATYLRKIGRKTPRRGDPNDRSYDRDLDRRLKRMSPLAIDAAIRDDEEASG